MSVGDEDSGLQRIVDMVRAAAWGVLFLHFYFYCYEDYRQWGWVSSFSDRLLEGFVRSGLFRSFHWSKTLALGLLLIGQVAAKGRKVTRLGVRGR